MDVFEIFFGITGRGWVEGALLLGLFWAALGHPERIRRPLEFRLAVLCLGVALAAAPLVRLTFLLRHPTTSFRQLGSDGTQWFPIAAAVPPLLLMLAIFLGVDSVLPRRGKAEA
ncbi:hypothetical protein J0H58_12935 [bacterium]|nr:hypothetical protein [bacterium]